MILRAHRAAAVLAIAAVAACTTTTTTTTVVTPTSVAVDPNEFLGNLACSSGPGAAQSYVASIYDTSDPNKTVIQTSDPVSCALPVTFQGVLETHSYAALIDVFDVPASQVMVNQGTETPMPAWSTSCGVPIVNADGSTTPNGAATVVNEVRTFIHGCVPLNSPGTGTTSITIDTASLVSPIGCSGMSGGTISSLNVSPTSPAGTTLPTVIVNCGEPAVSYDTGITAGTAYSFLVKAFSGTSSTASFGTTCTAVAQAGVTVHATCSGLTSFGSLAIDQNALLNAGMFTCGGMGANAASSYDVTFDSGTSTQVQALGVACDQGAVVGPLGAGSHGGEIVIRNAAGARIGHAICFATVAPGQTTTAPCTPD